MVVGMLHLVLTLWQHSNIIGSYVFELRSELIEDRSDYSS